MCLSRPSGPVSPGWCLPRHAGTALIACSVLGGLLGYWVPRAGLLAVPLRKERLARVWHDLPAALVRVELAADDLTVGEGVVEHFRFVLL